MRFEHWERRLNAVVAKHERLPFRYGRHDCVLFAADAVWALTQRDPAAAWRRTYEDEAGARAIIERHGDLIGLVEHSLSAIGLPVQRIRPEQAQRGEPCFCDEGPGLGVVLMGEIAAKNTTGLRRLPLSAARLCWAIR